MIEEKLVEVINKIDMVDARLKEAKDAVEEVAIEAAGYELIRELIMKNEEGVEENEGDEISATKATGD